MSTSSEYDLSTAHWHKSTYSGGSGGDCLEMATWRKSSHSGGSGGNCLEVNDAAHPGIVPVRDSKDPHGPALVFRAPVWAMFIDSLKSAD
jgi:hypothetical protein